MQHFALKHRTVSGRPFSTPTPLVILLVLLALIGCATEFETTPADRVVLGSIHTVDANNSTVEGFAVTDGVIVAIGTEAQIRRYIGGATEVTELLEEGAVVPGFIDGHSHLQMTGDTSLFTVNLTSPPVGQLKSMDDVVTALGQQAGNTEPESWVIGFGYDDTLLQEQRHPTRDDLDLASADHPILAVHVSGHLAVANSKALQLANITKATRQPEGGRIRKSRNGEPTGLLEEAAAFGRILALVPPRTETDRHRAIQRGLEIYAAAGITTAQNGLTAHPVIDDLSKVDAAGGLPVRVIAWPDLATSHKVLEGELNLPSDTEQFRIGATKIVADGSIQGYTGYLSEPYHVQPDHAGDGSGEAYRGYPTMSREQLTDHVLKLWGAGRQIAVHGNGDASIDDILFAYQQAHERYGDAPQRRPIIIHAQMMREDQLSLAAKLGVVPSFFELHTYYWGDRHRDIFMGPERAARMSPTKSALNAGIRFTVHADTPIVPMEPIRMLWAAVNRTTSSGQTLGSEQRLTVVEALRALTIDGAYQHFLENETGSIEVGKKADFVVLSADPLSMPTEQLDQLQVLETVVGGETVFAAN